eukprot:TRINITY_DN1404_c0_g1_i1.p1 TRINITY_DN1404_c0_g1~~TRINITY_DN1404_c0_g1_i1.p1  ORF type:complete len:353 (+),score=88.16 TRINITY_DN1404_c0_g1_i1:23-1060(+)
MQQPLMGQPGYPPPQQGGYPPQQGGYPPQQGGYPPQQGGYPPQQGGYPPQQQMMAINGGMDVLRAVGASNKLAIKQQVNLLEATADTMSGCIPCAEMCCERPNEYFVFDAATGQRLLRAKEESTFCCRCWCNPAHELKLHISDANTQQELMVVDRPFKCMNGCPALCDMCQQEVVLHRGNSVENSAGVIGTTRMPCCGGGCTPTVNTYVNGSQTPFGTVEGPCCCFAGLTEMCMDQDFPVSRAEGKAGDLGIIVKEKPETMGQALTEIATDSDLFTLTFRDASLSQDQKLVLLSSVLLLDYMFFEQNQPFECDGSTCSVTCCYMYIGGCLIPMKCSCGGGDDGGE